MRIKIERRKLLLAIILVALFLLPFLWKDNALYNLGGDDSRLYLYQPADWLSYVSPNSWFSNGLGSIFDTYNPQQFSWFSLVLIAALQKIFFFLNVQNILFGSILVTGFIGIYGLVGELLQEYRESAHSFAIRVIAGLFYLFLPINYCLVWPNPLKGLFLIGLMPLLFLFFVRALRRRKFSELVWGALVSLPYSFALASVPFLIPYLIAGIVFLGAYFIIIEKHRVFFIQALVLYVVMILAVNAFWLWPFADANLRNITEHSNLAFSKLEVARGIASTQMSVKNFNLVDHLAGFSTRLLISFPGTLGKIYDFVFKTLHLGLVFLALVVLALAARLKKQNRPRALLATTVLALLVMVFLLTVDIGPWGMVIFRFLIQIPGFLAIRNFWIKPVFAYSLFFSLALGFALYLLVHVIPDKFYRKVLLGSVLAIVLFYGSPFILGAVANFPIIEEHMASGLGYNLAMPADFKETAQYLETQPAGGRILHMPLGIGSWSLINDPINRGVFVGAAPFKVFTGKDEINSQTAFDSQLIPELRENIEEWFKKDDYEYLQKTFRLLGVRYLVYNRGVYQERSGDADAIREKYAWIYPGDGSKRYPRFIESQTVKKDKQFGDWEIYRYQDDTYLPTFFVPSRLDYLESSFNGFREWALLPDYNERVGLLFRDDREISGKDPDYLWPAVSKVVIPVRNSRQTIIEAENVMNEAAFAGNSRRYNELKELLAEKRKSVSFATPYTFKVKMAGVYNILIRQGSSLANNRELTATIGDQKVKRAADSRKLDDKWLYWNQVFLAAGDYPLVLFNNGQPLSSIGTGELVFVNNQPEASWTTPQISFRRISATQYRVAVKGAKESFPLVFLESFNPNWEVFSTSLSGGTEQAVNSSTAAGSPVSDDRLPGGELAETWGRKPLFADKHFIADKYANGWWVDLPALERAGLAKASAKGTYDFSLVVEFTPQRVFYDGLTVSAVSVVALVIHLVYCFWKNRKVHKLLVEKATADL